PWANAEEVRLVESIRRIDSIGMLCPDCSPVNAAPPPAARSAMRAPARPARCGRRATAGQAPDLPGVPGAVEPGAVEPGAVEPGAVEPGAVVTPEPVGVVAGSAGAAAFGGRGEDQ